MRLGAQPCHLAEGTLASGSSTAPADLRAPPAPLRGQRELRRRARGARACALPAGPCGQEPGGDDRAAGTSLVRRLPVPPGVHVHGRATVIPLFSGFIQAACQHAAGNRRRRGMTRARGPDGDRSAAVAAVTPRRIPAHRQRCALRAARRRQRAREPRVRPGGGRGVRAPSARSSRHSPGVQGVLSTRPTAPRFIPSADRGSTRAWRCSPRSASAHSCAGDHGRAHAGGGGAGGGGLRHHPAAGVSRPPDGPGARHGRDGGGRSISRSPSSSPRRRWRTSSRSSASAVTSACCSASGAVTSAMTISLSTCSASA
jgi:hypothetical protein